MTTIKLIPSTMEFEVSVDSGSMPSLFSQSMETTIVQEVTRQLDGRLPKQDEIVNEITDNREYSRKIRDWVMEEIDYHDISNRAAAEINYVEIAELLFEHENYQFDTMIAHIIRNARFVNMVQSAVRNCVLTSDVNDMIQNAVEEQVNAIKNDIADQAVKIINNRLSGGADV